MKKIVSMIMVLAMLLVLLCGCAGGSVSSAKSQGGSSASASKPEQSASEPTAEPDETQEPEPASGFPLTDEEVTITFMSCASTQLIQQTPQYEENVYFREMEKLTNVHIDHTVVANNSYSEQLNVLLASDSLTDMIFGLDRYSTPAATANMLEDGYILDCAKLMNDYMPAMKAVIDSDESIQRDVYDNEGRMYGFYGIYNDPLAKQEATMGAFIRGDLLDDLGMEVPNTYDEYHDVLVAFKNQGVKYPIGLINTVFVKNFLCGGYGIAANPGEEPFYVVDGKVHYGLIQPEAKELITRLRGWYDEGLISDDCVSANPFTWDTEARGGNVGVFYFMWNVIDQVNAALADIDPDYKMVAVPDPTVEEDGKVYITDSTGSRVMGRSGCMISVSANTEYAEIIAKYIDYGFTEEGSLLANYGVEGETFNYVDGKIQFTDLILHNDKWQSIQLDAYVRDGYSYLIDYSRHRLVFSDEAIDNYDVWTSNVADVTYDMPGHASMTTEDAAAYTQLYTDIATYAGEMIPAFVYGQRSLDEWDDFVATIESQGIAECEQYWQNAYDLYMAR